MKKYLKPIVKYTEVEPIKLFATSGKSSEDSSINLKYERTNHIWDHMKAD